MQKQTIEYLIDDGYTHWNNAERVGEIGIELESRTRLDLSRKFLRRALYLNPTGRPDWYMFLAYACFRDARRMDEDGESALTEGIEKTNSAVIKANYIAFMEDDQAAEEMIGEAHQSSDPSVLFTLASSLNWRGRADESLETFRKAAAITGDNEFPICIEDYPFTLGWAKAKGHDIDLEAESLPVLDRLIAHNPLAYRYRAIKLQNYQVLKDWQRVQDTCHEILEIMPDEETTMLALGIALEQQERQDEALMWYSRAIGAKPSFARARLNISKIYEKREQLDAAEDYLRQIPHANPDYTFGGIFLSIFLQRHKRHDEALRSFEDAYARLKTHEKSWVEQFPEGKELLKMSEES